MTKIFYAMWFGLLTSVISFDLSATRLTVSDNLVVSEIDGKTVEHGFIGNKSIFTLNQGKHALMVHYHDVFEDLDFAEDRVVKSKAFVIEFFLANEKQVKLTTVKIKNLSQAERFVKSPELIIIDENNKQLVLALVNLADYKLARQVDIAVSALTDNQTVNQAVLPVAVNQAFYSNKTSQRDISQIETSSNKISMQVDSLIMLKFWWQNATDKDKNSFELYIKAF